MVGSDQLECLNVMLGIWEPEFSSGLWEGSWCHGAHVIRSSYCTLYILGKVR